MDAIDLDSSVVLITGSQSLLASMLEKQLLDAGAGSVFRRPSLEMTGPGGGLEGVDRTFETIRPSVVVHIVGGDQTLARLRARPAACLHRLTAAGLRILDCAQRWNAERVLTVSCSAAYPAYAPVPLREENMLDGAPHPDLAPLATAQRLLIEFARAQALEHDLPVTCLVTGNIYGPPNESGEAREEVIPALVRRIRHAIDGAAPSIDLRGTGTATRDFIHVQDACRGIVDALRRFLPPDPMNLGSGSETRISDLASAIAAQLGFDGQIRWDDSAAEGPARRRLDTRRATELLDFRCEVPWERGLTDTVTAWSEHFQPPVPATAGTPAHGS